MGYVSLTIRREAGPGQHFRNPAGGCAVGSDRIVEGINAPLAARNLRRDMGDMAHTSPDTPANWSRFTTSSVGPSPPEV